MPLRRLRAVQADLPKASSGSIKVTVKGQDSAFLLVTPSAH